MPRLAVPSDPLSRSELDALLRNLFYDDAASPSVGLQAFTATAAALYRFCPAADVDAALLAIPRDRGSPHVIAHTPN